MKPITCNQLFQLIIEQCLPIQDKVLVLEIVCSLLNQCEEIDEIAMIHDKYDKKINPIESILVSTDTMKLLRQACLNKSMVQLASNMAIHHAEIVKTRKDNEIIVLTFLSSNQVYSIIKVGIKKEADQKIISVLNQVSFYVSILLDRLEYLNQLNQKNRELKELNSQLNKQIQVEIEKSQSALNMAETLSVKSDQVILNREIAHEINNLLAVIIVNTEIHQSVNYNSDVDVELIKHLLDRQSVSSKEKKKIIQQIKNGKLN